MSELTNPSSPSYVPIPYPKKREEIITDLLFAIKKMNPPSGIFSTGRINKFKKIKLNLIEDEPDYIVGPIYKVKNRRATDSDGYSWQILIQDKTGLNVGVIAMDACGLYSMSSGIFPHRSKDFVITDQELIGMVSQSVDRELNKKDVKRIERISFASHIGGYEMAPLREITMKDGSIYYYSVGRDAIYEMTSEKEWKRPAKGKRKSYWKEVPPKRIALRMK